MPIHLDAYMLILKERLKINDHLKKIYHFIFNLKHLRMYLKSTLFFCLKPIIRLSFIRLEGNITLYHVAFRLSSFQYIYVHQARKMYRSHVFCHIGILLNSIGRQPKLFYQFRASYYATNLRHIACFKTRHKFL